MTDTPKEPAIPPGKPLSMREERFIQGLIEGKKQGQAALDAGYAPESAANRASEKLSSLTFREKLLARAHARGIGVDFALDHVIALMDHETLLLGGKDKDISHWIGDGATRAKGTEMLLKTLGAFPDPRLAVDVSVAATVIVRSSDMLAPDPFSDGAVVDGEARELDGGTDTLP